MRNKLTPSSISGFLEHDLEVPLGDRKDGGAIHYMFIGHKRIGSCQWTYLDLQQMNTRRGKWSGKYELC
jgi:hypothetical protein